MATNQFPAVGIVVKVDGTNVFEKAMASVSKSLDNFQKQTDAAAKTSSTTGKALDKLGVSVSGLRDKFLSMGGVSGNVAAALSEITASAGLVALGIAAAVAAVAGFIALGTRGAALRGIAEGFDRLTASIGILSTELLTDLRRAAAGTISDFDLIRTANQALLGATGQFAQQFGKALPRLLEIARASARATGQDVNYLYDSIVLGIKRASPRILDNLGIIINEQEAYRVYAESIGKAVTALSDQDKQIAVLNATLQSGQTALDAASASQETAAEKLSRAGATISNILDKLGVLVQPLFEGILDAVNNVLSTISDAISTVGPYILALFSFIGDALRPIIQFIHDLLAPIFDPIFTAIGNAIRIFRDPELARVAFRGAARMIGSFASGILEAANRYVFPAILFIARGIADLLMGSSPPPEGPLSTIDQGGKSLMLAWLEGIVGVSLDPVKQVAAEVSAALGAIGTLSLPQVQARLARLDAALLPFQQRLAIVKSQFDALREPAEAALGAIDRQMEKAVLALATGDEQAAITVRALDAQRQAITDALDAQQGMVDAAQLQLSLAQAQQAHERTLLEIRQKMLGTVQKTVEAATGKKKAKKGAGAGEKPKAIAGGGAPTPPGGITPVAPLPGGSEGVLDLLGIGEGAISDAGDVLQSGFLEGLNASGQLKLAQENLAAISQETGRIGTGFQARFGPLLDFFDPSQPNSLSARLHNWIGGITDPARERSIPWFFNVQLPHSLAEARANLESGLQPVIDFFDPANPSSLPARLADAVDSIVNPAREGSIPYFFNVTLPQGFEDLRTLLFTGPDAPFRGLFEFFLGTDAGSVYDMIWGPMGLNMTFSQIPTLLVNAVDGIADWLFFNDNAPFRAVTDFLTGEGASQLGGILQVAADFFRAWKDEGLVSALQGLGVTIWANVAVPIISSFNTLLATIEGMLNNLKNTTANILDQYADIFNVVIAFTGTAAGVDMHQLAAGLRSGQVTLGRLSATPPAFVTGAAAGGVFGAGLMKVGERGSELMANATRTAVFPHEFVTAITRMTNVIEVLATAAPVYAPASAGNSGNSYDYSMVNNFHGVQDSREAIRRWRTLSAFR